MNFFDRYTLLCKAEGKSPTGVALELGLARSSVTRWKNGTNPEADSLVALANRFNVSTDYLLGNTDIKNPPEQSAPEDIAKVALFGGEGEVTDEMWEEVKNYVEYIKQKHLKG